MRALLLFSTLVICSIVHASDNDRHNELARITLGRIGYPAAVQESAKRVVSNVRRGLSGVPDDYWQSYGSEIVSHDYMGALLPVVTNALSEPDLEAIDLYFQSAAGLKELAKMRELRRRLREPKFDSKAFLASYYEPFTPEEAAASRAFRASEVGVRLWETIDRVHQVFAVEFETAVAEATKKYFGESKTKE